MLKTRVEIPVAMSDSVGAAHWARSAASAPDSLMAVCPEEKRRRRERLSDLLVLSCLSEDAKYLDLSDVVENFARLKSRRYPLMH